jgi:hypothetical protein
LKTTTTTMIASSVLDFFWSFLLLILPRSIVAKVAAFAFKTRVAVLERDRIGDIVPHDADAGAPSDTLLVAFAGGALQLGGQTQPEFVRSTERLPCDRLFVTDPSNAWYAVEGFDSAFETAIRGYRRVVLVGNCSGATGALRFAHLADAVIAINPQVDVHHDKRWQVRFAASRLSEDSATFLHRLASSVRSCRGVVTLLVDDNVAEDKRQAALLERLVAEDWSHKLRVRHFDPGSVKMSKFVRNSGELQRLFEEAIGDDKGGKA